MRCPQCPQEYSHPPATNRKGYERERNSDYIVWTETAKDDERTCKEKSISELSVSFWVLFFVLPHLSYLYVTFCLLSCLLVVIVINYSDLLIVWRDKNYASPPPTPNVIKCPDFRFLKTSYKTFSSPIIIFPCQWLPYRTSSFKLKPLKDCTLTICTIQGVSCCGTARRTEHDVAFSNDYSQQNTLPTFTTFCECLKLNTRYSRKVKSVSHSVPPYFRNTIPLRKGPKLRPSVRLVRSTCSSKSVSSTGVMTYSKLTNFPVTLLPTANLIFTNLGSNPGRRGNKPPEPWQCQTCWNPRG